MRNRVSRSTLVTVAFLLPLIAGVTAGAEPGARIEALFEGAVLRAGETELRPVRVLRAAQGGILLEGLLLTAEDGSLGALRLRDGKEAWKARTPDGLYPEVVEHGNGLAFVQFWGKQKRNGYEQYQPDPSAKVHRVSLEDGRWLEPLPGGTSLFRRDVRILQVLSASSNVVVLSYVPGDSDMHERQIKSYRVSCFAADSAKLKWDHDYKSAGSVPSCGVGLLFQGDRLYAVSRARHLSTVGGTLLVCAGAVEDIVALDLESGREKWRLPAVWEYQRGFIGPSVWQHFIDRFGRWESDPMGKKEKEAMRKDLAARCRIVGGPVGMPTPASLQTEYYECSCCSKHHGKEPCEQQRIFVAVSKAQGGFGGYLADCVIYEIQEGGVPIAVVNMPRMVLGSECFVSDEGVIWRCERGALAELRPSRQSRGIGMGGGGTDCIANLAWFVQPADDLDREHVVGGKVTNWLTCAKASDPTCFTSNAVYRLGGGAYIRKQSDSVISFPMRRMAFPSGRSVDLTLSVPFKGEVKLPETNYSKSGDSTYSFCPLYLNLVGMELHRGDLAVTLAMQEGEQAILLFPESSIREAATGGR